MKISPILYNNMNDNHIHKGLRKNMTDDLRSRGIGNEQVLQAMLQTPRHLFVPESYGARAYADAPLPIDCEQTISQPYTVARQTTLLEPQKGLKVLEIGTGSGYQTAVLKALNMHVYTIERHRRLYEQAMLTFRSLSLHVACRLGDGYAGWTEFAPYDRILVTCGAPQLPSNLLPQLKINGIMVIPLGEGKQIMHKIIRTGPNNYTTSTHGECQFVPMLKNINM